MGSQRDCQGGARPGPAEPTGASTASTTLGQAFPAGLQASQGAAPW